MTVTCVKDAWTEADKIFPTDYEHDPSRSERAGYPVYHSTAEGVNAWISDLGNRLEVNLPDGKSVNIWIEANTEENTTAENAEGLAAISQERKDLILRLRRATFAYTREYLNYLDKKEQEEIACKEAKEAYEKDGVTRCLVLTAENNAKVMLDCMKEMKQAIEILENSEEDVDEWMIAGIVAKLLEDQLRAQFRKNGRKGAVFLMDFHHFFPSAPHALIYQRHRDLILNDQLRAIADTVVASAPGGVGMPLGVEPSRQEMVALPSFLDNWMKCQLSIDGMGHYMDDYVAILDSVEEAEVVMEETIQRAEAKGLQVNRNKCHIVPMDKPFRFCKCKFYVTETGRVITHGARAGMKAARRKIHLYKRKVDAGEMTVQQAEEQLQGHIAYYENFDDHGRVLHLRQIIYATFKGGESHV